MKKKINFILYFNGTLTVSLQIWGLLLRKEFAPKGSKFFPLRVAPNAEVDGLRLSLENVYPFPSWTEKIIFWRLAAIAIYFQMPRLFPDFPGPYLISLAIHIIPWLDCLEEQFTGEGHSRIFISIYMQTVLSETDGPDPDWLLCFEAWDLGAKFTVWYYRGKTAAI